MSAEIRTLAAPERKITQPVSDWIEDWAHENGNATEATANAMAVRHADGASMDFLFMSLRSHQPKALAAISIKT